MSGHIIRQLEERHVAIKVDLMVWSNKMDLLALSNSKGEIALHRLTWQRVWLLPPPTPDMVVRKLAWRPDGRVIAVAYVPKVMVVGEQVKGEVMLIDVENKDVLHSITVSDDVSCLVWLQEKQFHNYHLLTASTHSQDGSSDFLPKLPSLSRTFGSLPDNIEENLEDAKRIKDQMQLNFLLIGTCDGSLHLSVFGLFSCGVMNINKYMTDNEKDKHTSVLNAEMSSDMKSLHLLVAVDKNKFYAETVKEDSVVPKTDVDVSNQKENLGVETKVNEDNTTSNDLKAEDSKGKENSNKTSGDECEQVIEREFKIVILDTRVLSSRSRELHALSLKHGHIISLLDYLSQTMRSIIEAWENIYILEIESKLSKHAASLPEGSVSADFLELLLFGMPSESLENFLMKDLNDKGIKKLGHSIELSHSNIQKLILKHLLSVGQSLAYHLAEMKGMAKLTDRFKVLGLEEETVAEAFSAAGAFLIKATEVQLVIDESMKRYKAFFRWLYAIILRITDDRIPDLTMSDLNQQDLEFIAEYLYKLDVKIDQDGVTKRHCYLDHLGQYLVNSDLTVPSNEENDNLWQRLLQQNPCLQEHFCVIKRCKNTSLLQQHDRLKEATTNVFKTPEYAIGNMFQLKEIVDIGKIACKRLSMCLVDDNMVLLSIIESNSPDSFQLIQIPTNGNKSDVRIKTVLFKTEDEVVMKCLDVQFYLPEVLSVLLEEKDENRNAVIVQMKSKTIYENTEDIINGNSLTGSIVTRQIPDLVASIFAVSGTRKVAIVLSKSRRKVRLFEMEAEDDDEEEEMVLLEPPVNFAEAQKGYYKPITEEVVVDDEENSSNLDDSYKLVLDTSKTSSECNSSVKSYLEERGENN
ncbi:anaphase-promoting complex subunit 4-like [Homalodisca vitripennis]|nr:anaphase-promoting complex subunit 4-like [Homalodisca vitripennis]